MAAYTSVGTGDWNDGPTTWGTGAGVYPGSGAGDTATVANTHNVTQNITTIPNVAAVTVSGGGTLTIGSNATANIFSTITVDDNGILAAAPGASTTVTLRHSGAMTMNGDWSIDTSAALSFFVWYPGANSTFGSTMTGSLIGRSKTIATQFSGTPTTTAATVDDVTGWEVGDVIAGHRNDTNRARVATTNNPVSVNLTYGSTTQMGNLQDNGRCVNLTRSIQIIAASAIRITSSAAAFRMEYVYRENVAVTLSTAPTTNPAFVGCALYNTNNYGCSDILSVDGINVDYVCGYNTANNWTAFTPSVSGRFKLSRAYLLMQLGNNSQGLANPDATEKYIEYTLEDVEVGSGAIRGAGQRCGGRILCRNFYGWGGANPAIDINYFDVVGHNLVLGKDAGGNANANTLDIRMAAISEMKLDNSFFSVAPTMNAESPVLISTQDQQVSGARAEYQRYGVCTKIADPATPDDFTAGVCDQITPSSTSYPFRYSIVFPCDTGKTPTLTFNQKATGTLGTCSVVLGYRRCGLTAIATGGTITPDTGGGVTQQSVTFTGTTDMAGEVEVVVEVLNNSTGVLMIGDIAVTGNL